MHISECYMYPTTHMYLFIADFSPYIVKIVGYVPVAMVSMAVAVVIVPVAK